MATRPTDQDKEARLYSERDISGCATDSEKVGITAEFINLANNVL
jgi:hypothetical protein